MKRLSLFGLSLSLFILVFVTACSSDHDHFIASEAVVYSVEISELTEEDSNPTIIKDDEIIFSLKEEPEDYIFTPEFSISDGATISPKSGEAQDFSKPIEYTVTSEDGSLTSHYIVKFIVDNNVDYNFSFESTEEDPSNKFQTFLSDAADSTISWDSGNQGFALTLALTGGAEGPESYPTYQIDNGKEGKAARLITKSTGSLGATFGAPMAAGNLFLGKFDEVNLEDAREGVHFGNPYQAKSAPIALKGYFKYKSGEEGVVVNNEDISNFENGDTDRWDAYAILFKKQDEDNFLKGNHDFDDPRIVAIAHIDPEDAVESDDWKEFNIPFEFEEGQEFDLNEDYMFTIVFSASVEGDLFNGAIGSTLDIDEVELVTEATIDTED